MHETVTDTKTRPVNRKFVIDRARCLRRKKAPRNLREAEFIPTLLLNVFWRAPHSVRRFLGWL